jgi:hypothetical protein
MGKFKIFNVLMTLVSIVLFILSLFYDTAFFSSICFAITGTVFAYLMFEDHL